MKQMNMSFSFDSRNLRGCTELSYKSKESIQYSLSIIWLCQGTLIEKYFEVGAVKVQIKYIPTENTR